MPDKAYDRVEVIKRAYRRLRRLDEVPDADGRGQGNIEKSEPLRPLDGRRDPVKVAVSGCVSFSSHRASISRKPAAGMVIAARHGPEYRQLYDMSGSFTREQRILGAKEHPLMLSRSAPAGTPAAACRPRPDGLKSGMTYSAHEKIAGGHPYARCLLQYWVLKQFPPERPLRTPRNGHLFGDSRT